MPGETPDRASRFLMRRLALAHLRQEGEAALRAGRKEQAQAYFRQALSLNDRDADLWALLGATFPEPGLRTSCAQQALALEPENALAHALLEGAALPSPTPFPDRTVRPGRETYTRGRILMALLLMVVLALNLFLGSLYAWRYEGCFFPGVRLAGLDLGGLSYDQARSLLAKGLSPFLHRPLLLEAGGKRWTFTAEEVGLRYRLDEALEEAWRLGRSGPALSSWWERLRLGLFGEEVPLLAGLGDEVLTEVLARLAGVLDRPAGPPELAWMEGRWMISPGRDWPGRRDGGLSPPDGMAGTWTGRRRRPG